MSRQKQFMHVNLMHETCVCLVYKQDKDTDTYNPKTQNVSKTKCKSLEKNVVLHV